MEKSGKSPLGQLVMFTLCLALAGSIVATMHYYTIDLPTQHSAQPPENTICKTELCRFCEGCIKACWAKSPQYWNDCFDECESHGCHV